jgi:hypothetical protein
MSAIRSQIYYINSENRVSGTSSNFSVAIDIPDMSGFDTVQVLQATIPLSFYLIRSPYNTFTLRELGVDTLVTVPEGNYDVKSFMNKMIIFLNIASPNHWLYTMNFDSVIAKYNYTLSGNLGQQPTIILGNHLGDQMGFNLNSVNNFVGNAVTSSNVLNFVSTNALFIHSDIVDDTTSILQEVYSNNTIPYSFITYIAQGDFYSKRLKNSTSSVFSFRVADEHGNTINLNGHETLITLQLSKKLPLADMFKAFLNLLASK